MRRGIVIGLLAGALIFAGAVGAKLVNVTNPMQADLDANYHAITNVSELGVSDAVTASGAFLTGSGVHVSVLAGYTDPTCCPALIAQPGSIYLRTVDPSHGQFWIKTGPNNADWTLVGGTP